MKGYETGISSPVVVFFQFLGRVETTGIESIHIWQPSNLDRSEFCYSNLAHENDFENAKHFSVKQILPRTQTAQAATVLTCFQLNETDIPTCRSENGNE